MIQNVTGIVVSALPPNGDPRFAQAFATPSGETGQINLTVITQAGTAYDLTGAQALLTVKDRNGSIILSRQATINAPSTGGTCYFPLVVADTLSLASVYAVGFSYDVWVTDVSGNRWQVIPPSPFTVEIARGAPGQPVTVPASQQPLAQGPPGLAFNYVYRNAVYVARFNDQVDCDVSGGSFNVTLPAISGLTVGLSGAISIVHGATVNSVGVVPNGSDKFLISGALQTVLSLAPGVTLRLNPAVSARGSIWVAF